MLPRLPWQNSNMKRLWPAGCLVVLVMFIGALVAVVITGAQQAVDVQAALKTVAPDLDQRLARFKAIRMPYNSASLSARERQMVDQLLVACRYLESMYWRQSDPD